MDIFEITDERKKIILSSFSGQQSNASIFNALNFSEAYFVFEYSHYQNFANRDTELIKQQALVHMLHVARNLQQLVLICNITGTHNCIGSIAKKRAIKIIKSYDAKKLNNTFASYFSMADLFSIVWFRLRWRIKKMNFKETKNLFEEYLSIARKFRFGSMTSEVIESREAMYLYRLSEKAKTFYDWRYVLPRYSKLFCLYREVFYKKFFLKVIACAQTLEELEFLSLYFSGKEDNDINALENAKMALS